MRLSQEYGIITEYTSFLVDDREQRALEPESGRHGRRYSLLANAEDRTRLRQEVLGRAGQFGLAGEGVTDQSATGQRPEERRIRSVPLPIGERQRRHADASGGWRSGRLAWAEAGLLPGSGGPAAKPASGNFGGGASAGVGAFNETAGENNSIVVQAVNDRTFYRQANNVWQDQSYDAKKNT